MPRDTSTASSRRTTRSGDAILLWLVPVLPGRVPQVGVALRPRALGALRSAHTPRTPLSLHPNSPQEILPRGQDGQEAEGARGARPRAFWVGAECVPEECCGAADMGTGGVLAVRTRTSCVRAPPATGRPQQGPHEHQ